MFHFLAPPCIVVTKIV